MSDVLVEARNGTRVELTAKTLAIQMPDTSAGQRMSAVLGADAMRELGLALFLCGSTTKARTPHERAAGVILELLRAAQNWSLVHQAHIETVLRHEYGKPEGGVSWQELAEKRWTLLEQGEVQWEHVKSRLAKARKCLERVAALNPDALTGPNYDARETLKEISDD